MIGQEEIKTQPEQEKMISPNNQQRLSNNQEVRNSGDLTSLNKNGINARQIDTNFPATNCLAPPTQEDQKHNDGLRKFWWGSAGPQNQGFQDGGRRTISSMDGIAFDNIKDSMFDQKIIDAIEKELELEDEENGNIFKDEGVTRKKIAEIKNLLNEEEFILDNLLKMTREMRDVRKIQDLIEAVCSDIYKRKTDKILKLDRILCQDDQQLKQIQYLEKKIRKAEVEVKAFKKLGEIKTQRQAGRYKPNPQQITTFSIDDQSSVYDWIVDIDLVTQVSKEGWKITLSNCFYKLFGHLFSKNKEISSTQAKDEIIQNQMLEFRIKEEEETNGYSELNRQIVQGSTNSTEQVTQSNYGGAMVAVVGLYDKGKTFVLNNLTLSNLPSGKKITTKGISFKHVNVDSGTNLILVDTAGSYSPVKINNELSIIEKEATEVFISDLVFEISDYFICVVNDFTSLDQRYLDKLSRNLQNSPKKTFREIIVIHNLKEVESSEILEHVWQTQVTQIYNSGSIQKTKVAARCSETNQLLEKHVVWFKTLYTRHICLANDDSELGKQVNPWVFSLLRYWLKAVFVPVERPVPVIDQLMKFSTLQLSKYFKTGVSLQLVETDEQLVKYIRTKDYQESKFRIPQMQIDSSGIVMTRPDNFIPTVDIIANEQYQIWMDVPSLSKDDIIIYRQNVITIVKGTKRRPYEDDKKLDRNERRYGDFTLTFKIPEIYERKWSSYDVENGVLKIIYDRDQEENNTI
ncbi:50S ribosome-binding GTPase (macronuclear) [Tetrahymena thermophila SB210]|uniref:50S ribosome-binding GTPase n=1 Tax=Tetrahymena thermophila (strain SB210) TaxID=312017 RepID=Q22NE9_TETTS|nr:50S ribosome-binding GTPase [Tetrahymena thermophila SB210]EAR86836.1 50S ribosome-binding GTPase [Tetrahymena thermophila SB210]|eukprot:XP_001007081.1 50S ribosome-binding GTPase [Tetrahymena thermophila SB210]